MMNVITKDRGAGKTTDLIYKASGRKGYIVCLDLREARRVVEVAESMDIEINFPLTFDEFIEGRFSGRGCKELFIDNLDMMLNRLARGAVVNTVTLTNEETL